MVDSVIRLFESTAQDFTSNGIGYLVDATSCKVTEERNGTFELEMKYPVTGRKYSDIALRRLIISKSNPYSAPQAFRIYEITKPINGIVSIYAEHISYDMSGYAVSPIKKQTNINNALRLILNNCITECPFRFWTDKATESDFESVKPSSMRSLLGGQEGSILDVYHAEFEFDNFMVKVHNHRGPNNGVTIRYGKNLTDLEQEENCANVYTGVYPYWYSEGDGLVQCEPKIILTPGTYNFQRVLTLDFSTEWVEKPTVEQLKTRAESYINSNNIGVPKVSLTISFVNLADAKEYELLSELEQVKLCDTVTVLFPALGVEATSKCVKTVYNVLTDKYESLELGEAKSNLATSLVNSSFDVKNMIIDTEDRLRTTIVKGDGLLRVEIQNETKAREAAITITADKIRQEVADDMAEAYNKIEQTADATLATVSKTYETKTDAGIMKTDLTNQIKQSAEGTLSTVSKTYETKDDAGKKMSQITSQYQQLADTIVMKVDADGHIVKVALSADSATGSRFDVSADNINLTANDVFKIMSQGTMDLTAQKIKITSDNFELDEYGNMKCTSLEALELKGKGIEDFNKSIMDSAIMKRIQEIIDILDSRTGDLEALLTNNKVIFDLLDATSYRWYSPNGDQYTMWGPVDGLQNYVSLDLTGYKYVIVRCKGKITDVPGGSIVNHGYISLTFSNDPLNNNPDTPVVNIVHKQVDVGQQEVGSYEVGLGPNGEGLDQWYNAYINVSALSGTYTLHCFGHNNGTSAVNGWLWCSKITLTNMDPS